MSLGLLGEYGSGESGSEISDSDDELNHPGLSEGNNQSILDEGEPPTHGSSVSYKGVTYRADPMGLTGDDTSISHSTDNPLNHGVSDSNSDSTDSEPESGGAKVSGSREPLPMVLPLPNLDAILGGNSARGADSCSVFSNPYRAAEEAKLAILKQHVDLVENPQPSRHGRRAKPRTSRHPYANSSSRPPPSHSSTCSLPGSDSPPVGPGAALFDDRDSSILRMEGKRKHRGGVGDTLMPTKKFMKLHQQLQAKERPWTVGQRRQL